MCATLAPSSRVEVPPPPASRSSGANASSLLRAEMVCSPSLLETTVSAGASEQLIAPGGDALLDGFEDGFLLEHRPLPVTFGQVL